MKSPTISIVIVSLDCKRVLNNCLQSMYLHENMQDVELILVDNGSRDGTVEFVKKQFPLVQVIENHKNLGFSVAMNQGLRIARGEFLVWLNSDILFEERCIGQLVEVLRNDRKIGVVGPMVLNIDRSFQPQCRRGFPTPWAVFCHFSGLGRLFPHSRVLSGYYMSYLPPTRSASVVSVSGCCLSTRRDVIEKVGLIDENIFGFGEDLDWCVRVMKSGFVVRYFAERSIVHLKGQGGVHRFPMRKELSVHQAMRIFYRKHLREQYSSLKKFSVQVGLAGHFVFSILRGIFFTLRRCFSIHQVVG